MISDFHFHKDIVIYIYCCIHMYKGSSPSYHCIRPPQVIRPHIFAHMLTFKYIYIYTIIIYNYCIYIYNYILKFSPSIRYHATLYTHCVYIYIPSDLPNRHSPKQYVPHLYPLLNTMSPHYSPFLLVKSSEFPLKLAISVVLLWKKPIETSSPLFGCLKPCWNPL